MTETGRTIRLAIPARVGMVAGAALLAAVGLAGCGGSKAASSTPSIAPLSRAPGSGQRGGGPAAFGVAAAISGSTVEVQDPSTGQVTVSFTSKTAFSQTKTVARTALAVGQCVTAIGARASGSATPAPSASGSGRGSAPTSFSAASVTIAPAVNGSCAATGFGGGRGGGFTRPSGSNLPRPSGSGRPSGAPGGFGGGTGGGFGGGIANGTLASLSGDTMRVQIAARGNQPSTTDTVTLTASTTYSETVQASSSALKVGLCVTATGSTDSTGAVAASRIALSTAGPNGCSTGFGRRPRPSGSTTGA